ncbi:hypothetical protein PP7435_CHR1-1508 [Komagataella phaffii CBS 7435]|uniref:Biogenesis of lysosome-related organelles complex 1 subunit KXD1 n=2 Tax=Komagataella phaffii TaxID=460519 RepID=C4QZ82_KOMPG|nr:Hypothetical protein PAS_FragB_0026 [Komagataella phaffii GS115]AOA61296.1 GQ67_01437T0 [Komagataella phaffii]CAH2447386.1 hypothetical protein BQ9382_C1-7870 [Komagataella phaffii CBS 7435]AOA65590.1 GQ68_01453T0 [Komagataella phaffii GS115]CAY68556.1 Hypothetical protein PAS_FragB_0026 [Komagataella phaffii GS115]CCA37619.1 hypothetical protein PP7435_CHR1-1508 [Komagataella phaffii CBS 7435]
MPRSPSVDSASFALDPVEYSYDPIDDQSDSDSSISSQNDFRAFRNNPSSREQRSDLNKYSKRDGSDFSPVDYLINSINASLKSVALDKAMVIQSQLSGELNNQNDLVLKKLLELETRLKSHLVKYQQAKKVILQINQDLASSKKRIKKITKYVKIEYPIEYSKAYNKVNNNITNDEEDLYG